MAGPLAGFAASLFLLVTGLEATSTMTLGSQLPVLPVDLVRASSLGGGLVQFFLGNVAILPQGPGAVLQLHPYAIAGFIGLITNALALLPLGRKLSWSATARLPSFAVCIVLPCLTQSALRLGTPFAVTDGGRISVTMFGRRGAFVVKLFTTLLLCVAGIFGLDENNIFLIYILFVLFFVFVTVLVWL